MFKRSRLLLAPALIIPTVLLAFQNCGREDGFETVTSEAYQRIEVVPPIDMNEDHGLVTPTSTEYRTNLVDRNYVRGLFIEIFGPSAEGVASQRPFLNGEDLGGPCSIYVDHNTESPTSGALIAARAMEVCSLTSGNFQNAKVNPDGTLLRQALMVRTCSDLVTNNTTFRHALSLISNQTIPIANQENMRKLVGLFYRGHIQPDDNVIQALHALFPAQNVDEDHWRSAVYTVCVSGYWQVN